MATQHGFWRVIPRGYPVAALSKGVGVPLTIEQDGITYTLLFSRSGQYLTSRAGEPLYGRA